MASEAEPYSWGLNGASTFLVGSVTRAVRTPSRVETDYSTSSFVNAVPVPTFVRLLPNPEVTSEKVTAYELGYRMRPLPSTLVTMSSFFNHLTDNARHGVAAAVRRDHAGVASADSARHVSEHPARKQRRGRSHRRTSGRRHGGASPGSYSHLRIEMTKDPGSMDVSQERRYEGLSPAHMGHAQSSLDLPGNVSVDWLWRGVARLPLGLVPAYNTSDVRLGWMATRRTEIAVVGRNLHDRRQQEWESSSVRIERGMHVEVTWRRRASVSHTRNVGPGRVRRVATGPPAAGDLDVGADPTGIALPPRRRGCPTSVCAEMRRRHGLWRPAPAPV